MRFRIYTWSRFFGLEKRNPSPLDLASTNSGTERQAIHLGGNNAQRDSQTLFLLAT